MSAWIGFDPSPVHAVGGFELHPVCHWITSSRIAETTAMTGLAVDGVGAEGRRSGGRSDGSRGGEKHFVTLNDIDPAGTGAQLDLEVGWVLHGLCWRIEAGREIAGRLGGSTVRQTHSDDNEGDALKNTLDGEGAEFHSMDR